VAGALRGWARPASAAGLVNAGQRCMPCGPVYCPSVYTDVASPAALALANGVMAGIALPGAQGLQGCA
jgi:hypothetical protein